MLLGLVAKIIPLLSMPFCRQIAMQSLSAMTHMSGRAARIEIAQHAPRLAALLRAHGPGDPKLAELTVATLSHSIAVVVGEEKAPSAALVRSLKLPDVLNAVCDALKFENATTYLTTHAMELLHTVGWHCPNELKQCPRAISFLVAMLRSGDIGERGTALAGVFRLVAKEAVFDQGNIDPRQFAAAASGRWPDDVIDMHVRPSLILVLLCR